MNYYNQQFVKVLEETIKERKIKRIISIKTEIIKPDSSEAEIYYYDDLDKDHYISIKFNHMLSVHNHSVMSDENIGKLYDLLKNVFDDVVEINKIENIENNDDAFKLTLTLYDSDYHFPKTDKFIVNYIESTKELELTEEIPYRNNNQNN